MKERKIIIGLIIINLIAISTIFNLLVNKTINHEKQIIKQMTATEYENSITLLNASHIDYANSIQQSKINLATAITNAGVPTSKDDNFETMINNVSNILSNKTSDATATAEQILSGQTAWVNGNKIIGTMTNNEAVVSTLNAGGSYTIPAGYHNGSGKVTVNSLASQTSATATANNITSGKTAWVNGQIITGNGADNASSLTSIYNALVNKGVRPASKSLTDIVAAINSMTVGGDVVRSVTVYYYSANGGNDRTNIDGSVWTSAGGSMNVRADNSNTYSFTINV